MTDDKKIETARKKLTILDVKEPQSIGDKGAQKVAFKAKGEDDKELWYFTFSKVLFEHIKKDTTIDAEIETSTREVDGNTYTDRKVTKIFVGGEAIGGSSGKSFGGGRWNRPDNSASIESQVAAKIGAELLVAKIISINDPLGQATVSWVLARLGTPPAAKVATKPTEPPKSVSVQSEPAKQVSDLHGDPEQLFTEVLPFSEIRPILLALTKSKVPGWGVSEIVTKLAQYGAKTDSGKVDTSYSTLEESGRKEFCAFVRAEAVKHLPPALPEKQGAF